MATTTTDAIAIVIRDAMLTTTPRITEGREGREWKFAEGDLPPRASARWFRFEWDHEGATPGGFFGPSEVDTTVTMSIVVDYGGIARHRVKIIAADDLEQLRDVFNRLKSSTTGLRLIMPIGWGFVTPSKAEQDPNQARVALQYRVRYMKARA